MAAKKKIQASDVEMENRTVDAILRETAEIQRENSAAIHALRQSFEADHQAIKANSEAIKANNEAIKTLQEQNNVILNEIRTISAALMSFAARTDERLRTLEGRAA